MIETIFALLMIIDHEIKEHPQRVRQRFQTLAMEQYSPCR